jgi:hypothetical protein
MVEDVVDVDSINSFAALISNKTNTPYGLLVIYSELIATLPW